VGSEAAIREYYTPNRLRSLISWRPQKVGRSLCKAFCKLHGTDTCPNAKELPRKGHCSEFAINAKTPLEAHGLLATDAGRYGIDLSISEPAMQALR
jgi:hypothetical protein